MRDYKGFCRIKESVFTNNLSSDYAVKTSNIVKSQEIPVMQ